MANGKDDIRVAASWPHHPKRKKLLGMVGPEGVVALIDLWCFAGENRPEGVMKSPEEVELVTSWSVRRKGALHRALVECGWLEADGVTLHDWKEEQPWIANRGRRLASARTNGSAGGLEKARRAASGSLPESYRNPSEVLPPSSPSAPHHTTLREPQSSPSASQPQSGPPEQTRNGKPAWRPDDCGPRPPDSGGALIQARIKERQDRYDRIVARRAAGEQIGPRDAKFAADMEATKTG